MKYKVSVIAAVAFIRVLETSKLQATARSGPDGRHLTKMEVTQVIVCLVGFVAASERHDVSARAQKGENCLDDNCAGRGFGVSIGGGIAGSISGGIYGNLGGNIGGGGGWRPRGNIGGGFRPGGSYPPVVVYPPVRYPPMGGGGGYPGSRPRQIGDAIVICYECGTGTLGYIAKIEQMILSLPMGMIRGIISIPAKIIGIALNLGSTLLNVCSSAMETLMSFVGTLFEIPAKVMMGGVKLFLGFLQKVLVWSQTCEGQKICQAPLPAFNGIGPCAGQWPCRQTVACISITCYRTCRALQGVEKQSDVEKDAF